ncbi:MAG: phage capsid protein [Agathobacter sp.]|nr:phage capsid protein [Agathobacter sp.]
MFRTKDAKKAFDIDPILSAAMDNAIRTWGLIVAGKAPWVSEKDSVRTINFAKFLCSDTAKKICLDIDVNVDGSARAEYLENVVNAVKKVLRDKVEDACCLGGIMLKPNGAPGQACVDYITPDNFLVTATNSNGDILGCVFFDYSSKGDTSYVRLEYQRFEGDKYLISNKAYKLTANGSIHHEIALSKVDAWADIEPEASIDNIDKTLFAYFKMPYNNVIDPTSPLGVPVFYNAINELRDLDIAWSRKGDEVEDSKHMLIVGASAQMSSKQQKITLPRFVKSLDLGGSGPLDEPVHEHVATMLTGNRIEDINSILSMISTKAGFSQGAFTLDRKTGMVTATQVESDDRETIETIKEMRDSLKDALEHLVYAVSKYADLYDYAPVGEYDVSFSFGDLTYSYDEDRARHWQYVQAGKYPLYRYYMKFEGMSEEEARALVDEAKADTEQPEQGLFR